MARQPETVLSLYNVLPHVSDDTQVLATGIALESVETLHNVSENSQVKVVRMPGWAHGAFLLTHPDLCAPLANLSGLDECAVGDMMKTAMDEIKQRQETFAQARSEVQDCAHQTDQGWWVVASSDIPPPSCCDDEYSATRPSLTCEEID